MQKYLSSYNCCNPYRKFDFSKKPSSDPYHFVRPTVRQPPMFRLHTYYNKQIKNEETCGLNLVGVLRINH